jgi:membrane associated rhomboid family serine protease
MTPWVRRLLALNVLAFLITSASDGLINQFVLVPALILERPWTVLTYQFLHAGGVHLLFNMVGLFFFGPRLEARIGSGHFIRLYLLSGICGAALSLFTPNVAIVGASGAVFGVLFGFARYWPRERIYIWGVIPIEARILVILLAGLAIFGGFSGGGNVAHFAHLGGFVGGWAYLFILERNSRARKFQKKAEGVTQGRPTGRDLERWEEVSLETLHPLNREEFLRVLEKARNLGPSALTPQERTFLDRFL